MSYAYTFYCNISNIAQVLDLDEHSGHIGAVIHCLLAYLCTAIDVEKVVNRTAFHVIKTLLVSIPKSPRTIKSESIKT